MYTIRDSYIHFRQGKLPPLFFVLLGQLGVYIHITGRWQYPYSVQMTESEFISCLEMAKEM